MNIHKFKKYITNYNPFRDYEFIYRKPKQLIIHDEKDDTGITIIGTEKGIEKFMNALSDDPAIFDELDVIGFRCWRK